MKIKKTYFVFKEKDGDYFRQGPNKEKLRFCGKPKFIIQALCKKRGFEKGKEVFEMFMEGVKNISDVEIDGVRFPAATYVLYSKDSSNVIEEYEGESEETLHNGEEEYSSYGENSWS